MKIILFSRKQVGHRPEQLRTLLHEIECNNLDYIANEDFAAAIEQLLGIIIPAERRFAEHVAPSGDDIVVSYGGDGTLLDAITLRPDNATPVVGINCGRLGYLTADDGKGIERLIRSIAERTLNFEHRTLIEVHGDIGVTGKCLALNEISIHRHGATMITIEACINAKHVATYHGDGLVVSTPTGSTAYSLSTGGPILDPLCRCFILSPLAPHNLTMRPIVIPDSSTISLRLDARGGEAFLSADNRTYTLRDGASITLALAPEELILATPHNNTFYDTLREKMMWGIDRR